MTFIIAAYLIKASAENPIDGIERTQKVKKVSEIGAGINVVGTEFPLYESDLVSLKHLAAAHQSLKFMSLYVHLQDIDLFYAVFLTESIDSRKGNFTTRRRFGFPIGRGLIIYTAIVVKDGFSLAIAHSEIDAVDSWINCMGYEKVFIACAVGFKAISLNSILAGPFKELSGILPFIGTDIEKDDPFSVGQPVRYISQYPSLSTRVNKRASAIVHPVEGNFQERLPDGLKKRSRDKTFSMLFDVHSCLPAGNAFTHSTPKSRSIQGM
jgi:hypothetical protein